jgi:hypothetical protein
MHHEAVLYAQVKYPSQRQRRKKGLTPCIECVFGKRRFRIHLVIPPKSPPQRVAVRPMNGGAFCIQRDHRSNSTSYEVLRVTDLGFAYLV